MILRRGKQPRAVDCFIHENVAVVIARLAISAAILAMMKIGQKATPAERIKNFLQFLFLQIVGKPTKFLKIQITGLI